MKKTTALLSLALSMFFLSGTCIATPITVLNHSFEEDSLAEGAWIYTASDWSTPGDAGTFNPTSGQYNTFSDGENVAYTKGQEIGQVLSSTLAADTLYTLNVDVGWRLDNSAASGYNIGLWAGSNLLASVASSADLIQGEFVTVDLSYISTTDYVGENLKVVLDTQTTGSWQTNFDNVRLDAQTTVPEPSSLLLFTVGLVGLGFARRKK